MATTPDHATATPRDSDRAPADPAAVMERLTALARRHQPPAAGGRLAPDDVVAFVRQYYRRVPPDDLAGQTAEQLYDAAADHLGLALRRKPGEPNLRLRAADAAHPRATVEVVTDDMPFLIDTLSMELARHGLGVELLVHPILVVRRDGEGELTAVLPPNAVGADTLTEAVIHIEVSGALTDEAALRADLLRVLDDVRATVVDWRVMRDRALEAADALENAGRAADAAELAESADFLRWLAADHFTFVGARDYDLVHEDGEDVLRPVADSGLGILRRAGGEAAAAAAPDVSASFARLPAQIRKQARSGDVLTLTKAQSRSTVHRATHLDYVGAKRYDAGGTVVGERRFLGIYTSSANRTSPSAIPLLRRKVQDVVKRAGFAPGSHDGKMLVEIIEGFPRDELLQISPDELYETALGILALQERPRVRLFLRRDPFGRFVSCLVYVPRDRYTTAVRERVQRLLETALNSASSEYTVRVTESPLARLHLLVYTDPDRPPEFDGAALQERLAEATRSWQDDLVVAATTRYGEEQGRALIRRFGAAFPAAYVEDFSPELAAADLTELAALDPNGDLRISLRQPQRPGDATLRFTLYRSGTAITLSDVLPVLENMGVRVVDERPYALDLAEDVRHWIYDFGVAPRGEVALTPELTTAFADAFAAIWRNEAENDGFNRLVLLTGLSWREISLLRAFAKYLRQVGTAFSQDYMTDAVTANPDIARQLVELFHARLDPDDRGSDEDVHARVTSIEKALDQVASLDQDRILRNFLRLELALLRTNYYQPDTDGSRKPYLSFKFDPTGVPDAPLPLPLFEIWVYSPRTEGVHLRGGRVARGGIRWSDRREDFRTEILGLMKAQMVKNAVIVPVGSKGGFVVKRPPESGDRSALMDEVVACYRTLIRGMLDITDNLVSGSVVPPPRVVRHDGDDPYLVVAADKGTATFSDIANALALDYGYWLGDAFASGGSAGYDHKEMGITAKGAWESVKRHFRELGLDTQTEDFTVVGIGDMSGDVFGNGMLLSRHIRLVAAFDHRHVFIDPDPDAAASFEERLRLYEMPRSSWADYDQSLISAGGGVFPRTAKRIPLSPQARRALAVDAEELPPAELIRAILRAPVDLLWNGGIGTYVKASTEVQADAGDRTNDALRIDAGELRCRVVGEGGNLGFTQRARIEYALAGGKINTDAIDNSAGVDTSDHEVNIKILLDDAVKAGGLDTEQRNEILASMTDEVAALVLRDNYDQTRTLSNAAAQARPMLTVHRRLIGALERSGRLNRAIEFLPTNQELTRRADAGRGLTRPELAVLLAYSKITFYDDLLDSDAPEDAYLRRELVRYFPHPLRDPYAEAMHRHPLHREIVATCVTNGLINRAGITLPFRLHEETGASAADVARAWTAAREMFDLPQLWAEVDGCDLGVPADVQTGLFLEVRKLHERGTRWLLRHRRQPLDVAATINAFAGGIAALTVRLRELLPASDVDTLERVTDELAARGVPDKVARWVASCGFLVAAPDIVEVATDAGEPVEQVAGVYYGLDERLGLGWLHDLVAALPREDRWQTLARGALRDDLYAAHAALARDALRCAPADADAGARIGVWARANEAAIARVDRVLGEIREGRAGDLATLSVALREVRSVVTAAA